MNTARHYEIYGKVRGGRKGEGGKGREWEGGKGREWEGGSRRKGGWNTGIGTT